MGTQRQARNYKPSSSDLANATLAIYDTWHADVVLDDSYREKNGVDMNPGEYSLRELLNICYGTVDVWNEQNYGNCGARTFLVNLVERGLLTVEKASQRGLPSKYTIGINPATGQVYTRDEFSQTAYAHRTTAYRHAQAQKAEWRNASKQPPQQESVDLSGIDFSDIAADM